MMDNVGQDRNAEAFGDIFAVLMPNEARGLERLVTAIEDSLEETEADLSLSTGPGFNSLCLH